MTAGSAPPASVEGRRPPRSPAARTGWRSVGHVLTLVVIWVPLLISAAHVVGFTLWTTWLSFTPSDLLPEYTFVGLRSYWSVTRAPSTQIAYVNLVIYSIGFVALATLVGFVLAVLLDQRIRGENVLRTIYLYPLAVSFVVTGTYGAGCSIPASASRSSCAISAGRLSASTGSSIATWRSTPS
jgi:ABC-type sugar transport system permease subunit